MKHFLSIRRAVRLVAVGLCLGLPVFSTGCVVAAVGVGAGAVAWYKGELKTNLKETVPEVNAAVQRALDELGLFKISAKSDKLTGAYTVRNAKDDKITILVERSGEGLTVVRIRVGVFGDEALSRSILDAIRKEL